MLVSQRVASLARISLTPSPTARSLRPFTSTLTRQDAADEDLVKPIYTPLANKAAADANVDGLVLSQTNRSSSFMSLT